jgi:hypothetical protein
MFPNCTTFSFDVGVGQAHNTRISSAAAADSMRLLQADFNIINLPPAFIDHSYGLFFL